MSTRRAEPTTNLLTHQTVLGEWFEPMTSILAELKFSDTIYTALPMKSFVLFGVLRQILAINTLREQVQNLFNFAIESEKTPLARSTWADALASPTRCAITRELVDLLVFKARETLPDKFSQVDGLSERPIIAFDTTYIKESSHFNAVTPKNGGRDNEKGHAVLLAFYWLLICATAFLWAPNQKWILWGKCGFRKIITSKLSIGVIKKMLSM
jgi:hypothetical protein